MRAFDWVNKEIAQKLIARFTLSESPLVVSPYILNREIQAITNVDDLLTETKAINSSLNLTVAASTFVPLLTVANNKRIRIRHLIRAATVSTSRVEALIGGVNVRLTGAVNAETIVTAAINIILEAGDQIGSYGTANAGDTAIVHMILYEEEDAF